MYLIRSGTVVTAEKSIDADVLVEGEKVVKIGKNLSFTDAKTIDASGKFILPGGIDPHTHFDLPMFDTVSSDDHYTGHKAAAFGGTTTVMDFIPQPDEGKLADGVAEWRGKADPKAAIDFGFHMNITRLDEEIEKEIPKLLEHGIPTLKVFTAYNGKLRLEDDEIFRVLKIAKELDLDNIIGEPTSYLASVKKEENQIVLSENKISAGIVPDVRGIGASNAVFIMENAGLRVKVKGVGKVKIQSLPPGSKYWNGQTVYLTLI